MQARNFIGTRYTVSGIHGLQQSIFLGLWGPRSLLFLQRLARSSCNFFPKTPVCPGKIYNYFLVKLGKYPPLKIPYFLDMGKYPPFEFPYFLSIFTRVAAFQENSETPKFLWIWGSNPQKF